MSNLSLIAGLNAVPSLGNDANLVEWADLKAKIIDIINALPDTAEVTNTHQYVRYDSEQSKFVPSVFSAPNGSKTPGNSGQWGLGHSITPALRFDSTPGTGILAGVWNTSPTAAIAGHTGLEFIANNRRMIAMFPDVQTGDPTAVFIHGYGTNRLMIESEAAIVFNAQTKGYEFEQIEGDTVVFMAYTAGTGFTRTIEVKSEQAGFSEAKCPIAFRGFVVNGTPTTNHDAAQVWHPITRTPVGGFTWNGHPWIPTTTYANDAAAAAAGIRIGSLYWNGSVLTQRRS